MTFYFIDSFYLFVYISVETDHLGMEVNYDIALNSFISMPKSIGGAYRKRMCAC